MNHAARSGRALRRILLLSYAIGFADVTEALAEEAATPQTASAQPASASPAVLESYVTPAGRTVFRVPGSVQPELASYQTPSGRVVLRAPGSATPELASYRSEAGRVIVRAPSPVPSPVEDTAPAERER